MQPFDSRTALIVVDMQNDFADPDGSLSVSGGEFTIPVVNAAAREAILAGAFVAYTQDWHPLRTPHFAPDGGIWPVHCVADTWGAALHPALTVPNDAARVRKGVNGEDGYSGFTLRDPVSGDTIATALEGLLRASAVDSVIVCGLATDYCVKATALDAVRLGFETSLLIDAVAAVDLEPGDGARAIEAMEATGVTMWRTVTR